MPAQRTKRKAIHAASGVMRGIQIQQGLLNIREFAHATGWSPATVRAKVWKREVEFVRMGRSIRFRPETVQQLIEDNTVPALVK